MGDRKSSRVPGKPSTTLGPIQASGLKDIEPELKIDGGATYEEAGPTITRQGPDGVDKTRIGKSINSMGPVSGGSYDIEPEIATDHVARKPPRATKPCEGCGWPLEVSAHVCSKCGYDKRTGESKKTAVGEEEKPDALPDRRFQTYMHDPKLSKRSWMNATVILIFGLAGLLIDAAILGSAGASVASATGATSVPTPATVAGMFLGKFAISLVAVAGLYVVCCHLFLDYLGPLVLAIIRLGAAVACADALQRACELSLLVSPTFFIIGIVFGCIAAMILFMALIAELLEVEFQEAIFFTGVVYASKIFLALVVYPALF